MGRSWKKHLSLLLVVALTLTILPISFGIVHAAISEVIQSKNLTINGEKVDWILTGDRPSTFKDSDFSVEYWDAAAIDFALTHEFASLAPGIYTMKAKVYSEELNNSGSLMIAETMEGIYSTAIDFAGSAWGSPVTLTLEGIEVGTDGKSAIGFIVKGANNHWGHLYDVTFTPILPEGSVERIKIAPSSINLRPGVKQQIKLEVFPIDATVTDVVYSSSNSAVATVDPNGLVTAVANGDVTITATAKDGSGVRGHSFITVSDTWQDYSGESVQVQPISQLQDGQRQDFIMGVDISTIYEIEQSGRKYYDLDGNEKPAMEIFQENGVNWIRLRVWNDPKDEHGNWYGAGNTDKDRVVVMAEQAKQLGLKVLIDFHYSDFWTDPGQQNKPKAWRALNDEQMRQALYDYTYDVIHSLAAAGAYPDMVQIGNEINSGMLWTTGNSAEKAKPFIEQGIAAVRKVESDVSGEPIKIMIHRANPDHGAGTFTSFYDHYKELDYDVIGISYYPFWHGSFSNIRNVMNTMASTFDKEVVIVETSYAYTLESDEKNGLGNIFGPSLEKIAGYEVGVRGQATLIRDVIAAVAEVPDHKGLGIFYWEPAWLPGVDTGWATLAGAAYSNVSISGDEGSGWSNQAMFNFFGEALPSIEVFHLVRQSDSDYTPPIVQRIDAVAVTTSEGVMVPLPTSVPVLYSDGAYRNVVVEAWSPNNYDFNKAGNYKAEGIIVGGGSVTAHITVTPKNYIINPGLESSNMSAWELVEMSRTSEAPYTGSYALHFWNRSEHSAKQAITGLPKGIYRLTMWSRIGGDPIGDSYMFAESGEVKKQTPLSNAGWSTWKYNIIDHIEVRNGMVEIGAVVNGSINAGGDFDDWELIKVADLPGDPTDVKNPPLIPGSALPQLSADDKKLAGNVVSAGKIRTSIPALDELTGKPTVAISSDELNSALKSTASDSKQRKTVIIDIPQLDGHSGVEIRLPAAALTAAVTSSLYEIRTSFGTITMTNNMLETLQFEGAKEIIISIAEADKSLLSAELKSAIGDRPVLELNVIVDGSPTSWSNPAAAVTVTIPYTSTAEEVQEAGNIVIWHINASGIAEPVPNAVYDSASGLITFTTTHFSSFAVAKVYRTFSDLTPFAWAQDAIEALAASGVTNGTSKERFSPHTNVKRADYVVMLVRSLGLSAKIDNNFADVNQEAYYYEAIGIAKALGITSGVDGNRFLPERSITREELMLLTARAMRAADRLPDGVGVGGLLESFTDQAAIAGHALDSISQLVHTGIVNGKGNAIAPKAAASRAEAAVIIYRAMKH